MATLTPLVPNGDKTVSTSFKDWTLTSGTWNEETTGCNYTELDDAVGAIADGDTGGGLPAGHQASYSPEYHFSDVDADFASMLTLSIHYDIDHNGNYSDDSGSLKARIWNGTNVALTDEITLAEFNGTTWTTPVGANKTTAFTLNAQGLAADEAEWNGAYIRFTGTDTKNKGSDLGSIILVDFELTGTYSPVPNVDQTGFRWRADGSETDGSWLGPLNTHPFGLEPTTTYLLRVLLAEDAGGAPGTGESTSTGYKLQYRIPSGTWVDMTTTVSTTIPYLAASAYMTDGDTLTQQLGSGTFGDGFFSDDNDLNGTGRAEGALPNFDGNEEAEVEFGVRFPTGNEGLGWEFRVVYDEGASDLVLTQDKTIYGGHGEIWAGERVAFERATATDYSITAWSGSAAQDGFYTIVSIVTSVNQTITPPSGWTVLANSYVADHKLTVYGRLLQSGDGLMTWTWPTTDDVMIGAVWYVGVRGVGDTDLQNDEAFGVVVSLTEADDSDSMFFGIMSYFHTAQRALSPSLNVDTELDEGYGSAADIGVGLYQSIEASPFGTAKSFQVNSATEDTLQLLGIILEPWNQTRAVFLAGEFEGSYDFDVATSAIISFTFYGETGGSAARGQSFKTPTNQTWLHWMDIYTDKVNAPTDKLVVKVYTALNGGTLVATSDEVDATDSGLTRFTFAGGPLLDGNTTYYARVTRTGARSLSQYYRLYGQNTNPYANGEASVLNSGTWSFVSGNDVNMEIGLGSIPSVSVITAGAQSIGVTAAAETETAQTVDALWNQSVSVVAAAESEGISTYNAAPSSLGDQVFYGETGADEALGQSWSVAPNGWVDSLRIHMDDSGLPTDDVYVEVATSLSGTAIAKSDEVSPTVPGWNTFTFPNPIPFFSGTLYFRVYRTGSRDTGNYWTIWSDIVAFADGKMLTSDSGTWTESESFDLRMDWYVNSIGPVLGNVTVPVGKASEAEAAQTVTPEQGQTATVVAAAETETAQTVAAIAEQVITVAAVVEAETAQTVTPVPGAVSVAVAATAEREGDFYALTLTTIDSYASIRGGDGEGTTEAAGQTWANAPRGYLTEIGIITDDSGTPTDKLKISVADALNGGTILAVTEEVDPSTSGTLTLFPLIDPIWIDPTATYYFRIERTGSRDVINYWRARIRFSNSTFDDGDRTDRTTGTWSVATGDTSVRLILNTVSPVGIGLESVAATEVETAGTVTPLQHQTIGVTATSETEAARTVTPVQATVVPVGATAETETARPVTVDVTSVVTVTTATETETAQTVTPVPGTRTVAVTAVAETETAVAVGVYWDQSAAIAAVTENEVARAVTLDLEGNISQAAEVEVARPVAVAASISVTVGKASETEAAGTVAVELGALVVVVAVNESELARTVTPVAGAVSVAVGKATETESALPVLVLSPVSVSIGTANESESANPVTVSTSLALAVVAVSEVETAEPVVVDATGAPQSIGVVVAPEVETGVAVGVYFDQSVSVLVVAELENSRVVYVDAEGDISQAGEVETARPVTVATSVSVSVGVANETESAEPVAVIAGGAPQSIGVSAAAETESAETVTVVATGAPQSIGVTAAAESESAVAVGVWFDLTVTVGAAAETETAGTVTPDVSVSVSVGVVAEVEVANVVTVVASGADQSPLVGVANETESSLPVGLVYDQTTGVAATVEAEAAGLTVVDATTSIGVAVTAETETAETVTVDGSIVVAVSVTSEVEAAVPVSVFWDQAPTVVATAEVEVADSVVVIQHDLHFWRDQPVGFTKAPASFTKVKPEDTPPW